MEQALRRKIEAPVFRGLIAAILHIRRRRRRQSHQSIRLEIKVSGREALGILADANGDIAQRWKEITNEIKKERDHLNPKIPRKPKPAGTIIDCKPRIGIWLMPDNKSPGELEDFAAKIVPKDDSVWLLSEKYIENIPKNERKFAPDKMPKAKLFAWLAARKEPGRMGAAVGAGDLTLNNELGGKFLKWLSELFR